VKTAHVAFPPGSSVLIYEQAVTLVYRLFPFVLITLEIAFIYWLNMCSPLLYWGGKLYVHRKVYGTMMKFNI